MKIFCPTRGLRPTSSHTIFPPYWDFYFVVDSYETKRSLEAATGAKVIAVEIEDQNPVTRLAEIRNAIEGLVNLGEWFVEIDDDCGGITMLEPSMQELYGDHLDYDDWSAREWHQWFRHRATPEQAADLVAGLIAECERMETIYGGFSFFDNPFYRKKKFAYASYVNGGLHVKRKDGRQWRWTPAEDMEMSCYCLRTYGATVVNRWGHGLFKDSSEGGVGSFTPEWECMIANRQVQLLTAYPGLLKADGFRLKITKNSLKSVQNWRRANGWI